MIFFYKPVLKITFLLFFCTILYSSAYAQAPADTQKQVAAAGAAAKKAAADAEKKLLADAEKIKKSLVFKVFELFKFKSNVRENQKKRILEIVESLGIQDSINVSAENIKFLIEELSKRENQHFDTLITLIGSIKIKPDVPSIAAADPPDNTVASSNNPVSDSDIDALTSKILPLVTQQASQSKNDKDKREKIAALREVAQQKGAIQEVIDTANGIVKRFTTLTSNKVKVLGFLNYNKEPASNYNFQNFDKIIYNGLFVDCKTANFKSLNGWDISPTLFSLEQAKIYPIVNLIFSSKDDFSKFLLNKSTQKSFFRNTQFLLAMRLSEGVCLQINELDPLFKNEFTSFIRDFNLSIKGENKNYQIYLILPNAQANVPFDFENINEFIDSYLLDFYNPIQTSIPTPIASIKGKQLSSIESTVSYYTNLNIAPDKLILGLGYQGARWSFSASSNRFNFSQILTYGEIRRNYQWPVMYDDENGTATMDSINKKGILVRRFFLEDQNTLEKKYDFVLQNGLGGVALYALGFDESYGELNDMLMYKFSQVDTLQLQDSIIDKTKLPKLSLYQKFSLRWKLYHYILNNPCEICFENIEDPVLKSTMAINIHQLGFDTLAVQQKTTTFVIANKTLNNNVLRFGLIVLIICLVLSYLLYLRIKNKGEENTGKYYKTLPLTTLVFWFIFIVVSFLYLFTSDMIPYFGMVSENQYIEIKGKDNKKDITVSSLYQALYREKSKAQAAQNRLKITPQNVKRKAQRQMLQGSSSKGNSSGIEEPDSSVLTASDSLDILTSLQCTKAKVSSCINIPFITLLSIIMIGIFFGIFMAFLLIKPLLKKKEVP